MSGIRKSAVGSLDLGLEERRCRIIMTETVKVRHCLQMRKSRNLDRGVQWSPSTTVYLWTGHRTVWSCPHAPASKLRRDNAEAACLLWMGFHFHVMPGKPTPNKSIRAPSWHTPTSSSLTNSYDARASQAWFLWFVTSSILI